MRGGEAGTQGLNNNTMARTRSQARPKPARAAKLDLAAASPPAPQPATPPGRPSSEPPLLAAALGHPLALSVVCPVLYLLAAAAVRLAGGTAAQWGAYCALLVILPAVHCLVVGPTVFIINTVSVTVNAPLSLVSAFLREPRNLACYEQKVTGCVVSKPVPTGCHFTIWGGWFGLPFSKTFKLRHTRDGGFHSQAVGASIQPPSILRFRGGGGFRTAVDEGSPPIEVRGGGAWSGGSGDAVLKPTTVTPYERYGWPVCFPLIPILGVVWRRWHRRGMEVEMELIKAQVEFLFERIGADPAASESVFCADHSSAPASQIGDAAWKYSVDDFLRENLSQLICRPMAVHHPDVGSAIIQEDAVWCGRGCVYPQS